MLVSELGKALTLGNERTVSALLSDVEMTSGSTLQVGTEQIAVELERGARIEKEHVGNLSDPINYAIARDIARDHIKEFPNYYDGLEKLEKSLAKQNGTVDED